MPGCEAVFNKDENKFIIRPKNGAKKGVISYSLENKKSDFEAIRNILTSDNTYGATLEFKGTIYGYGSISGLFSNTRIKSLGNICDFDVSNVTDMSFMFRGCKNLAGLSGLENWKTGNVVNMQGMFGGQVKQPDYSNPYKVDGCEKITSLKPLSSWDTKNVTDMSYMFKDCKGLNDIGELSQWDVSKVMAMTNLFSGCESLESIVALSNWKTSNVKYMGGMFSDCKKLKSIKPLEKWDTSNLESVYEMFARCTGLTGSIKLNTMPDNTSNAWNTNSLIFLQSMFEYAGSENFILDFSNKNFNNKKNFKHGQLLSGVTSFNNKNMFKNFNGVVIANNWSFVSKPGKYSVISSNFTANLLSDENDASGNKTYKCLFLTDNDVLLEGMKNLNYNKAITVNYSGTEIKLYRPAVLDSRINGGGRQPSSDPFEIVKHYIPAAVEDGAKTLRSKNEGVPTDYIAVADKELSSTSKLSELFQTYEIKAAHTVTFKNDEYNVANVKVEAGGKIEDLAKETIVTSDAVLTGVTMPNAPAKEGFTFKEWNTQKNGNGTTFTADTAVNADTTVYAIYVKNTTPTPQPQPQPPTPNPNPNPTPNPAPQPGGSGSGDNPGNNPDGGSGNNPNNNPNNNPDNGSDNTPGSNPGDNPNNNPGNGSNNGNNTNGSGDGAGDNGAGSDNTGSDNTKNNGNGNGGTGNGGNNTNGSNTNRNRNGGSTGGSGLNAGGSGSNSSNSAKSNASDSAKDSSNDSAKDSSKDYSDSSDSAKDSVKDSAKDSAKSSASSSVKRASKSSNFGLIASIIGALVAVAAVVGGFFFLLFAKKRKKRKDEDEN